jgi:hypothetical protein
MIRVLGTVEDNKCALVILNSTSIVSPIRDDHKREICASVLSLSLLPLLAACVFTIGRYLIGRHGVHVMHVCFRTCVKTRIQVLSPPLLKEPYGSVARQTSESLSAFFAALVVRGTHGRVPSSQCKPALAARASTNDIGRSPESLSGCQENGGELYLCRTARL